MNKEDLFEGFGALDDDLLKRSEREGSTIKNRRYLSGMMKYGSIAACLAAVVGATVFFINKDANPVPDSDGNIIAESNDNAADGKDNLLEENESYVAVSTLLASDEDIVKQNYEFKLVEIEEYSAMYYKVASVDSNILKESTGRKVEGAQNLYKLSGHDDIQYLICEDRNKYSLWKFDFFQEENYPYNDVLQIIYNINSAEDIREIIVNPADMDNTDEGKEIQYEIGTSIVADDKYIEMIYNVLSGLVCYGSGNWDKIGLLEDDSPLTMQNQVKAGRYLTLVTSQGMEIDSLKYTGISGMFYEYGGIAYRALTVDEKSAVEEILNIESIER